MKANELMIGDWVVINNIPRQITFIDDCLNYKIIATGKHQDGSRVSYVGKLSEEVKPIPLVLEILEKNGFKKQSGGSFLLEDLEDYYWVKFYPKDNNYTLGAYGYIDLNWGCISIREMPIEFVHELQHALRLCGIEKEIIL